MPALSGGGQPERLPADAPLPGIKTELGLASAAPPPARKSSHIDPPALTVDHAVWAKVKGFPWWPARVQEVSGQTVKVLFFGTEQLGKVRAAPSSCVPFSARGLMGWTSTKKSTVKRGADLLAERKRPRGSG